MVVGVIFNEGGKIYYYNSEVPLIKGGIYDIVTGGLQGVKTYDSYVKVVETSCGTNVNFRKIISARIIRDVPKPEKPYKKIFANEEKRTTCVVWKDGTRTVMKAHPDDEWDVEKGVAMCFMKKAFNNRGCYYDAFRDIIEQ